MLERSGWRIKERNGLRFYCLTQPGEATGRGALIQGVFTRRGGVSKGAWKGLNVGHTVGDDPRAVQTNHDLICQALGIAREAITNAQQVHGAQVAQVTLEGRGATHPATDGLITDVPGVALMLRFADCVPLLFFDPRRRAVGLAHAGWRGTLAGIAARTVGSMQKAFGSVPEELVVGIGPAIGPCCYEVGPDLADRVCTRFPQAVAQCCTACHEDEFYSHRSACLGSRGPSSSTSGEPGRTGRFAAVIGLRAA
jgi:YfiH family protein